MSDQERIINYLLKTINKKKVKSPWTAELVLGWLNDPSTDPVNIKAKRAEEKAQKGPSDKPQKPKKPTLREKVDYLLDKHGEKEPDIEEEMSC